MTNYTTTPSKNFKCKFCTHLFFRDEVHKAGKSSSGKQNYSCRPCNKEVKRRQYNTPQGKELIVKTIKKYEQANPKKVKAWLVRQRTPRKPCEVCGEENTHRHHPDYNQPDYIVYLCPKHHKAIHKNQDMSVPDKASDFLTYETAGSKHRGAVYKT